MTWRWPGRALALAAILLSLAQPALATSPASPRPPNTRPETNTDEGGLWYQADQAETTLRGQGDVVHDEALNTYVHGVVCRVAHEYCDELRVYVLNRPFVNANMAPNGYTEVWSGLLLRADDEAELAFVLSHEATHFSMNHSLLRARALRTQSNVMLAVQVGLLVAGAAAAANAGSVQSMNDIMSATQNLVNLSYLATIAAYFQYSREQEDEADRLGFARAAAAGYDPRAGVDFWQGELAETAASDFPQVRNAATRINIFNSHPQTADRLEKLQGLANGRPASGDRGHERYRAAIRPFLSVWLRDELRRRDFGQTLLTLNRLGANGEDVGVVSFFRGECYRLRREDGDAARAVAAYEDAAQHADAPPEAWREMGNTYLQLHDSAHARTAFESYLAHAPAAQDRWLVEASLRRLNTGAGQ